MAASNMLVVACITFIQCQSGVLSHAMAEYPSMPHQKIAYDEKTQVQSFGDSIITGVSSITKDIDEPLIETDNGTDVPVIERDNGTDVPVIERDNGIDVSVIERHNGTEVPVIERDNGTDVPVIERDSGTDVPVIERDNGTDVPVIERDNGTDVPVIERGNGTDVPVIERDSGTDVPLIKRDNTTIEPPIRKDNGTEISSFINDIKAGVSSSREDVGFAESFFRLDKTEPATFNPTVNASEEANNTHFSNDTITIHADDGYPGITVLATSAVVSFVLTVNIFVIGVFLVFVYKERRRQASLKTYEAELVELRSDLMNSKNVHHTA